MSKYLSFSSWACGSFAAALLLLVLVAVPQKVLRAQTGGRAVYCNSYCKEVTKNNPSAYQTCYDSCLVQPGGCSSCTVSCVLKGGGSNCSGTCNRLTGCDSCGCKYIDIDSICKCQ